MPIVCGTDFSGAAAGAIRVAARIAKGRGETLWLVHVAPRGVIEEVRVRLRAVLAQQAGAARAEGADVREAFEEGEVAEVLAETAGWTRSDLLVVAGTGEGASAALGRTADRVAELSRAPTLVVRDADVLAAWAARERPLRVLVAADASEPSEAAIAWLADLRAIGPVEAVVGRVASPIEERARLGAARVPTALALPPDVERELAGEVGARVEAHGAGPAEVRIHTGLGRVDDHVRQLAEEARADLVVVGTHRRHGLDRAWHGSVSRGVLVSVPASVCFVPASGVGNPDA